MTQPTEPARQPGAPGVPGARGVPGAPGVPGRTGRTGGTDGRRRWRPRVVVPQLVAVALIVLSQVDALSRYAAVLWLGATALLLLALAAALRDVRRGGRGTPRAERARD